MAALTVVVWSLTFVNTKALLESFSAMEINFIRFFVAYIALWILHPKCLWKLPWKEELRLAMMGLSGVGIYQIFENCAIHYTNASNVSILVSTAPISAALFMRFLGDKEPLHRRFFTGSAIALIGVILVSLKGIPKFHFNPLGDLMAMGAVICWGWYSLMVEKQALCGRTELFVVRRMFFWALISMVPFLIFGLMDTASKVMDASMAVQLSPQINATRFASFKNCFNFAFLGFLAGAICFVTWNKACVILGTTRCNLGLYLMPAITTICASLFLKEPISVDSVSGTLLIIFGVFLAEQKDAPKAPTKEIENQ